MSASAHCHHPELAYKVVTAIEGGKAYAEITAARCPFCGKRWRFVGLESRFDPGMPTANRNATKVLLPMVEILNG
jgi:hypothetical protein